MLHQDHIGFVFTKYRICNVATFDLIRFDSIVEGVVSSVEQRPSWRYRCTMNCSASRGNNHDWLLLVPSYMTRIDILFCDSYTLVIDEETVPRLFSTDHQWQLIVVIHDLPFIFHPFLKWPWIDALCIHKERANLISPSTFSRNLPVEAVSDRVAYKQSCVGVLYRATSQNYFPGK